MSTSNPFEEIEQFFERMSRQFDESTRGWSEDGPLSRWSDEFGEMAVDLVENDEAFVATVDLPGFEKSEVDVRVTDHTLHVEAEHDEAEEERDDRYLRRERRHESMRRSVKLPDEVDKENVTAQMNNGVLTVTVPKVEASEARTIEVQ